MKKSLIWLDGTFVPWEHATIHVMTHTLHYGSGAFEGIRCYKTDNGPAIFRLSEHVARLRQSFSCFSVTVPWTQDILEKAIIDTIIINNLGDCYIRPLLFFGSESLLLSPKKLSVHCAIIAFDMDKYLGTHAIRVGISSIKRIHPDSMPIHNKINGFYVNSIFAFHEVSNRGFDEALLLDHNSAISEGSVANIFIVIDGILKTPTTQSILPGITRASILTLAHALDIPIEETVITLHDIYNATEAFFCGTASEITPILCIEDIMLLAPGPITQKITSAYRDCILSKNKHFKSWLTSVQ